MKYRWEKIIEVTIGFRGRKAMQHDLVSAIEFCKESDATVFILNEGIVHYSSVGCFERGVWSACKRCHLDVAIHNIKGDDHRIMLFKK